MLAMVGRRMWYRCRHDEWVLVDVSNKSAMDGCSMAGVMSGLMINPCCARLMVAVMVIT